MIIWVIALEEVNYCMHVLVCALAIEGKIELNKNIENWDPLKCAIHFIHREPISTNFRIQRSIMCSLYLRAILVTPNGQGHSDLIAYDE
jgi:hypothetical protein